MGEAKVIKAVTEGVTKKVAAKEIKEKTGYPVSSWLVLFLYYDKWKVSLYEVANLYYFSHIYFTSFDLKSLLFINIFLLWSNNFNKLKSIIFKCKM